jgi:hypothetical protein
MCMRIRRERCRIDAITAMNRYRIQRVVLMSPPAPGGRPNRYDAKWQSCECEVLFERALSIRLKTAQAKPGKVGIGW